MCSTQQPWAVSDTLAYGFAATSIAGGTEATWCCACYALTFTSTSISGKTLIVQSTNTGSDLGSNQFDLAVRHPSLPYLPFHFSARFIINTNNYQMPGGGSGIFDGCVSEWGNPSTGWGAQYGGISDRSDCDAFPAALQPGCHWRFEWFENANNPTVSFQQVECPAALTTKSGCVRANDSIDEAPTGASVTGGAAVTSSGSGSSTTTASGSTGGGSTTSSGTAAQYGQCGGTGWTGPTTCVSPYTCTYSSAYYSQCL
jgi:hypothetical protein